MINSLFIINNYQFLAECGGRDVFPGVLQVEFPLLIPELGVGESVQVAIAQP